MAEAWERQPDDAEHGQPGQQERELDASQDDDRSRGDEGDREGHRHERLLQGEQAPVQRLADGLAQQQPVVDEREPVAEAAQSQGGDVSLDLFGQPARTEAESDGGDVHVTVPYGPYRVDATADTGEVKVEGLIRDDLAPQRIAVLTKVGDVTVRAR